MLGALAGPEGADVGGESRLLLGRVLIVLEHGAGLGRAVVHRVVKEEQELWASRAKCLPASVRLWQGKRWGGINQTTQAVPSPLTVLRNIRRKKYGALKTRDHDSILASVRVTSLTLAIGLVLLEVVAPAARV